MELDNFICGFCLNTIQAETYPTECSLKVGSKMCHGCGMFFPKIEMHACREGSTASAYQYQSWERLTLGKSCKHVYSVWVSETGQHVLHRTGSKGDEVVRIMTDEEVAQLDASVAT